jgi:hypothetical protein
MSGLVAPRFFGEEVLEACLGTHRISAGSGDPPETIAVLQQALADLGFTVDVDGVFGAQTAAAVTAYKTGKGLVPNDPVVGSGTMRALDDDFTHELIDRKAAELAGTRFDLGFRMALRVELSDSVAICVFQNGVCVEIGHTAAYAVPARALATWTASGGIDGTFGAPTADPFDLDAERSVQEFAVAALVFGGTADFVIPRPMWEASLAGGSLIGNPVGPPTALSEDGSTFVPHDSGVVLSVPGASPQALPQPVFELWAAQENAGASLGPPVAFAFPGDAGLVFPFRFGSITLDTLGIASLTGLVTESLQRYFQPEDDAVFLSRPIAGTVATPLIGGDAMFKSLRADIASANGPADFVYILSWHCNIDLELVPGDASSTLRALLGKRAASSVQVRAMLWAGDPVPHPSGVAMGVLGVAIPWELAKQYARMKTSRVVNQPAVNFIESLAAGGADAAAVLDDRHLFMGSHHQKVVVIRAGGKLVAYVGGIEANVDRLQAVAGELGSPLFDASVRLEDAGAWLVLRSFILRWDMHPARHGAALRGASLPMPAHNGPLAVQVTHTYGRGFPFAVPVQTAAMAIANGIKSARQFFYMEDQYYVGSPMMATAIRDALSSNPNLVGIINIAAEFSVADLPDVAFRRRAFLAPLVNAFPGRLLVFERLGNGSPIGPTAYVHTKLLIVDDEAAFIGSVNSSRRSWFHDSEIDVTIVDSTGAGGAAPGARGWVRGFRADLWARHFNLASALLGDFGLCLAIWRAVISGQLVLLGGNLVDISGTVSVRPYDVNAPVTRFSIGGVPLSSTLLNSAWDTLEDPA